MIHQQRRMLLQAMDNHDKYVVVFWYRDRHEVRTKRVVSPIRFESETRFLGLCLTREEPRSFDIDRCSGLRLDWANKYVMPWVPVEQSEGGYVCSCTNFPCSTYCKRCGVVASPLKAGNDEKT